MSSTAPVLLGAYFYPRGGSAQTCRASACELLANGRPVTVLSGSRTDLGASGDALAFYAGLDVRVVDFTPALRSPDPLRFAGEPGTGPIHGSYEDRPGADDVVLAALDADAFELQVTAWSAALEDAAGDAELLLLHHLTPLNEAAARVLPGVPIVGHLHGTELLMLEQIEDGAPPGWTCAGKWAERMRGWAADCERIVVNSREGLRRAAGLLDLEEDRFSFMPNGFEPRFSPRPVDRERHWRNHLGEELQGAVLLYVGRFTAVKRLPLLIEAFAIAQRRARSPAALVLVGGHPGEWEGEHPAETIERLGVFGVFLAGWHDHAELPDFLGAADALAHAAANEQFGQALVEAMACELPVIAIDRGGPAAIVDDGETGWLVPPEDPEAMAQAMVEAIDDPRERRRRGLLAREEAVARYSWQQIGRELAELLDLAAATRSR